MVDPKDKMADGQPCAFCDFRYNSKASPLYIKQHMIDIKEGDYLMNRPRQVRPCKPIAAKRAEHDEKAAEILRRYRAEERAEIEANNSAYIQQCQQAVIDVEGLTPAGRGSKRPAVES